MFIIILTIKLLLTLSVFSATNSFVLMWILGRQKFHPARKDGWFEEIMWGQHSPFLRIIHWVFGDPAVLSTGPKTGWKKISDFLDISLMLTYFAPLLVLADICAIRDHLVWRKKVLCLA